MSTIPDGVYDNQRTWCREWWWKGELQRSIFFEMYLQGHIKGDKPGTYPDLPCPQN